MDARSELDASLERKKGYLRSRGWKDLIFLCVVLALGYKVKLWDMRESNVLNRSDFEKWQVRPQLGLRSKSASQRRLEKGGAIPCFFLVSSIAGGAPVESATVGDCLMLVPDGRKLDLFEVNLWTGEFVPIKTDLYVQDSFPLAFTRTYRPFDDWSRRYQIYLRDVYDLFLFGDRFPYTYSEWLMPDGIHVRYRRISPGTGYADYVAESKDPNSIFEGSRISWNGNGWDLTLADGTTYLSPEAYYGKRPQQGSLVGIFDKNGNEVRLSREPNGDLTEVKSPSGLWIRFAYDEGRIVQAKASTSDFVGYDYDSEDRLRTARYSTGETMGYSYDSSNRIVRIEDSSTAFALENKYDAQGFLTEQTLADGRTYHFQLFGEQQKGSLHIDITDSASMATTIVQVHEAENGIHYTVEKRARIPAHR